MANYKNHLVDPSYFYDVIEEFAFDYDIYVKIAEIQDEYYCSLYIWFYRNN